MYFPQCSTVVEPVFPCAFFLTAFTIIVLRPNTCRTTFCLRTSSVHNPRQGMCNVSGTPTCGVLLYTAFTRSNEVSPSSPTSCVWPSFSNQEILSNVFLKSSRQTLNVYHPSIFNPNTVPTWESDLPILKLHERPPFSMSSNCFSHTWLPVWAFCHFYNL